MKFSVVDVGRINVYLTKEELEKEHISLAALYANEETLESELSKIFRRADEETGFGTDGEPLEVEIIPIIDGDLFISISKTGGEGSVYMNGICCHTVFSDVEDVISLCGRLSELFSGASDLYLFEGAYHLLLYPKRMTQTAVKHMRFLLQEYGTDAEHAEEHNVSNSVLSEHGRRICKGNCVQLFTKVFKNI